MNERRTGREKLRVLIFYRGRLALGGVETYMYQHAKRLRAEGWTIGWVRKHPFVKVDDTLTDLFLDRSTLVWNGDINKKELEALVRGQNAEIRVVTFTMHHFSKAEKFKRAFNLCPVHTFYFVSHDMGEAMYLEENHTGENREKVRNRMARIVQSMDRGGNIRYFNGRHIEKMTANYGYTVADKDGAYVPSKDGQVSPVDIQRCKMLHGRERFNLLTVTRFDFPHKGYVIGLIKAYGLLKPRYPRLELTVVGYGRDQAQVDAAVAALDEAARRDVHMEGKAAPEQLVAYYRDANLNISVAGCCSQGARQGTPSIPARHYDYSCEVYGFLPESKLFLVSDKPGEPVIGYIEQVLNMPEAEYCKLCEAAADTFRDDVRKPMDQIVNASAQATLTKKDINYIACQELWREVHSKLRRIRIILKKILKQKG